MLNDKKYSDILNNKLLNIKINKLDDDFNKIKTAYPSSDMAMDIPGEYNLPKWVQTLKDIYFKNLQQKMPWKQAFDSSTNDWNPVEKLDFNNWINYYQNSNHLKYKKAWYVNNDVDEDGNQLMPGYMIPNAEAEVESAPNATANDISSNEKNQLLRKLKSKVISRLDSLERLLRTEEGFLLSETENDSLIDTIHSLKKKVYSLKRKASEVFYQDLIIREANVLANKGLYKAASFLYVTAQQNAPVAAPAAAPAPDAGIVPAAPSAAPAAGSPPVTGDAAPAVGAAGAPPAPIAPDTGGGTSPPAIGSGAGNNDLGKALTESLGFGEAATVDSNAVDDLFIIDGGGQEEDEAEIEIQDEDEDQDEDLLLSLAQVATLPPPMPSKTPSKMAPLPPIKRVDNIPDADITVTENFDNSLNSVLSKVTVEDVLNKMEQISKIFKTREIPRQLSIVDMMLDQLGLASFFPSLSEATNKALESNNYILTRMEDIIMQLSGAVKTQGLDLQGQENDTPEHALNVRRNLENQEKTDQKRKEMRKQLADQALEERTKDEAPNLEVTEDELEPIAPPPAPATPPPAQAKPLPPVI